VGGAGNPVIVSSVALRGGFPTRPAGDGPVEAGVLFSLFIRPKKNERRIASMIQVRIPSPIIKIVPTDPPRGNGEPPIASVRIA
jgi:hypothetical protein